MANNLISPMNYHLDGHGLHGTLLASAAQKASRRHEWRLMLFCMGLFVRAGKLRYVLKKLSLYMVEDSNIFAAPTERAEFLTRLQHLKRRLPRAKPEMLYDELFELVFLVCQAPKSRIVDHSICVAGQYALDLQTGKVSLPSIHARLQVAVAEKNWQSALGLIYLTKLLHPNALTTLWAYLPRREYYSRLILSDFSLWNQELLMCESALHLRSEPFEPRDWPPVDWSTQRAEAKKFWTDLMVAPLNYELRGWIDWKPWIPIVWDKHTNRGHGQNTLQSLLARYPDVPEEFHEPDGPPMVSESSLMTQFFDVGVYLPREALVDPFWLAARTFFLQVEQLGKKHGDYVLSILESRSPQKRKALTPRETWAHVLKSLQN